MKIQWTILFVLLLTLGEHLVKAEEFNYSFQPDKKGFPVNWSIHEWRGYQPFPTVTVQPVPNNAGQYKLRLANISGKDGGAILTKNHFPVRSGGVGRISFLVRGKGTAWVTFYRWGDNNQWNGVVTAESFVLSELWQPQEITIPINNGHACETKSVTLAIGGKPGAELELKDLQLDIQPSNIIGDVILPQRWTSFVTRPDFSPSPKELTSLPSSLDDATGKTISLNAHTFDFSPLVEKAPCSLWLFTEINTPFDCEADMGLGSNQTLKYYLNGKIVFDIKDAKSKTSDRTVNLDDKFKRVLLKKGKNIIALHLPGAKKGTELKLGGPTDLRGITRRLRPVQTISEETFDSSSVKCSGTPRLIRGNPTPGLLTVTGQGVFRTNDSPLIISLQENSITSFPGKLEDSSSRYLTAGLRIQNFDSRNPDGQNATNSSATFEIRASVEQKKITTEIHCLPDSRFMKVDIRSGEKIIGSTTVPVRMLPADLLFGISAEGNWAFSCCSLADSQTIFISGKTDSLPKNKPVVFDYCLIPEEKKPVEMTADNLVIAEAILESKMVSVPYKMQITQHFDPVKAGWPLVFQDEFDGNSVNRDHWFFSPADQEEHAKVHDGMVEITADWNKEKTKLKSVSLYSNQLFGYGYYEARVKFRQQSGWWSAFWLCSQSPSNPFTDGWEIDIYEDYYMGPSKPGEAPRCILDHNLHVNTVGTLRSWNYNSKLPGEPNDFYVIACKWTPFEVSYYLNGSLIKSEANHSPYDSVTFDPFHHAAGFVPLHAILSGCCGRSGGDPHQGTFPESFFVDYVRIYNFPTDEAPKVEWKVKPQEDQVIYVGDTLRFEAVVHPSNKTKAKIQQVYLFDSGALLESKSEPPYTFEVKVTPGYYNHTDIVKPGRSGVRPRFDCGTHAYVVYVQDENGQVSHTRPIIEYIRRSGNTRPYQGKPALLPGKINLAFFDEGGDELAYSDASPGNNACPDFRPNESVDACPNIIGSINAGEWTKYTVKVQKTGTYRVTLRYGTPARNQLGPKLIIDGSPAGQFIVVPHKASHWGADTDSVLTNIKLAEGDHELILLMQGSYNISTLTFELE